MSAESRTESDEPPDLTLETGQLSTPSPLSNPGMDTTLLGSWSLDKVEVRSLIEPVHVVW